MSSRPKQLTKPRQKSVTLPPNQSDLAGQAQTSRLQLSRSGTMGASLQKNSYLDKSEGLREADLLRSQVKQLEAQMLHLSMAGSQPNDQNAALAAENAELRRKVSLLERRPESSAALAEWANAAALIAKEVALCKQDVALCALQVKQHGKLSFSALEEGIARLDNQRNSQLRSLLHALETQRQDAAEGLREENKQLLDQCVQLRAKLEAAQSSIASQTRQLQTLNEKYAQTAATAQKSDLRVSQCFTQQNKAQPVLFALRSGIQPIRESLAYLKRVVGSQPFSQLESALGVYFADSRRKLEQEKASAAKLEVQLQQTLADAKTQKAEAERRIDEITHRNIAQMANQQREQDIIVEQSRRVHQQCLECQQENSALHAEVMRLQHELRQRDQNSEMQRSQHDVLLQSTRLLDEKVQAQENQLRGSNQAVAALQREHALLAEAGAKTRLQIASTARGVRQALQQLKHGVFVLGTHFDQPITDCLNRLVFQFQVYRSTYELSKEQLSLQIGECNRRIEELRAGYEQRLSEHERQHSDKLQRLSAQNASVSEQLKKALSQVALLSAENKSLKQHEAKCAVLLQDQSRNLDEQMEKISTARETNARLTARIHAMQAQFVADIKPLAVGAASLRQDVLLLSQFTAAACPPAMGALEAAVGCLQERCRQQQAGYERQLQEMRVYMAADAERAAKDACEIQTALEELKMAKAAEEAALAAEKTKSGQLAEQLYRSEQNAQEQATRLEELRARLESGDTNARATYYALNEKIHRLEREGTEREREFADQHAELQHIQAQAAESRQTLLLQAQKLRQVAAEITGVKQALLSLREIALFALSTAQAERSAGDVVKAFMRRREAEAGEQIALLASERQAAADYLAYKSEHLATLQRQVQQEQEAAKSCAAALRAQNGELSSQISQLRDETERARLESKQLCAERSVCAKTLLENEKALLEIRSENKALREKALADQQALNSIMYEVSAWKQNVEANVEQQRRQVRELNQRISALE